MKIPLRELLAALAVAILTIAPDVARACSVCSAGRDDETRAAFIATTIALSVLPLALIGGFVWWIRRRVRAIEEPSADRSWSASMRPGAAIEDPRRAQG